MVMNLKAWPIVVGILADSLGSIAVGALYLIGVLLIARGAPESNAALATPHWIIFEIVGLFFTGAGGFVAARMARTRHIQHGAAVGVGALLLGVLVEWVIPADPAPVWYAAVSMVSVIPAGALGGYAAARRANSPVQPPSGPG
jgi:putative membrane protein (TIGR04086 family)